MDTVDLDGFSIHGNSPTLWEMGSLAIDGVRRSWRGSANDVRMVCGFFTEFDGFVDAVGDEVRDGFFPHPTATIGFRRGCRSVVGTVRCAVWMGSISSWMVVGGWLSDSNHGCKREDR
ncbi:hypothetical protein ACLOJK_020712 [Asimina triloba]